MDTLLMKRFINSFVLFHRNSVKKNTNNPHKKVIPLCLEKRSKLVDRQHELARIKAQLTSALQEVDLEIEENLKQIKKTLLSGRSNEKNNQEYILYLRERIRQIELNERMQRAILQIAEQDIARACQHRYNKRHYEFPECADEHAMIACAKDKLEKLRIQHQALKFKITSLPDLPPIIYKI